MKNRAVERMKIGIVHTLYFPHMIGGAEVSVQMLAEGLALAGHEVFVITGAQRDDVQMINGVRVYYCRSRNLYWNFFTKQQAGWKKFLWHLGDMYNPWASGDVGKILEREKPDVMHTNNVAGFSVALWDLIRKKGIPLVHTLRDYYLLCPNSTMFKRENNCSRQCALCQCFSISKYLLSDRVDAIIGVSQYILNKHLAYGYFSKAGVQEVIYSSIPLVKGPFQGRVPDKEKNIHFGYIGQIAPYKGVERIMDVFLQVPRAQLWLYGKSVTQEYGEYLRKKYRSSNIHLMGFRSMEDIYSHLHVTIVPSLWQEPFPRVILESFAAGVPVIAARRGGIDEVVKDGDNGYLFDPDQKGSLRAIVENLVCSPERLNVLREHCLDAAQEFSVEKHIARYAEIYQQVICQQGCPAEIRKKYEP